MYSDVIEYTEDMTDEQLGQLYRAQLQYANGINPVVTDPEVKGIWRVIKHQMDVNSEKYESKRKQLQANASKSRQMHTDAIKSKHTESDTDTVTVSKETTPNGVVKKAASRFTPPSVEEVAAYCAERKNHVNAQQFVDFYASKGWKIGKDPMKDWKAAVRTWEQRDEKFAHPMNPPENPKHGMQREEDLDAMLIAQIAGRESNGKVDPVYAPGSAGYYPGGNVFGYSGP